MHTLNRIFKIFALTVVFFYSNSALFAIEKDSAQSNKPGEYSLVVYAGGGVSQFLGSPGVAQTVQTEVSKTGFSGSLRVMWHPDHMLRLGLETGRIPFYSYTIENNDKSGDLKLTATPVILVWSMPLAKRFNVFLGYGIYILNSELEYAGKTNSSTNSLGFLTAVNYIHPLSDHLGIAGEIKYLNANETKDKILNYQVQLVWKFYKW